MTRANSWQADASENWQQRKSAHMRETILTAARDCLVEGGYRGLTTIAIVQRTGISRGALHHHFANRVELVGALIDFVLHRRLAFFVGAYRAGLENAGDGDLIDIATDLHWQSVQTEDYAAYLELALAARTDVELADILVPATRAFDAEWMEEMERIFPQWNDNKREMLIASDLASAVHLGLLVNRPFMGNKARRSAVRDQLLASIKRIYQSES